jgi:hypothetical protein
MSKAKILKLKTEVTKMESVYSKSSTSDKTKAILKKAIDKAKGEIEKLEGKAAKKEPAKKEPKAAAEPKTRKKRKKATPLERLKSLVKRKKYSAYSKTGVDLEKDAGQPALPTGKRKSKSGKTYYEYRANRIDVKQPPKRYPKLEDGGETVKFEVDDVVYHKGHNTVGIVRMGEERGEVKTDADGNVDVSELEYYNPLKHKAHKNAKVAPSTLKEIEERMLWKPFSERTSQLEKGGYMAKGGGTEKPMSYYKYETPKVTIYWKGKPQPLGRFKSAEEAYEVIKKQSDRYGDIKDYEIHTPDKIIKLADGGEMLINPAFVETSKFPTDNYSNWIFWKEEYENYIKDLKEKIKADYDDDEVSFLTKQQEYELETYEDKLQKHLEKGKEKGWYEKGGYMADGGKIKDQYDGREPEDIWNNLSRDQRSHFLFDHAEEIETRRGNGQLSGKEISDTTKMEYSKLDKDIKNRFDNHVRQGQYKGGGSLDIDSYADGGELKKDYLVTFDSQTQDFQPTTFQASSIYDLMETLRETVPAEVEILSIEQMTPHGVMEYGGVMGY